VASADAEDDMTSGAMGLRWLRLVKGGVCFAVDLPSTLPKHQQQSATACESEMSQQKH